MKIVKPSVEFWGSCPTGYLNTLCLIERAGRLCYRSEDKITGTSAEPFVKGLIKREHLAMVEHSNFVVRGKLLQGDLALGTLMKARYLSSRVQGPSVFIGGNLTAWKHAWDNKNHSALLVPFFKRYGALFGLVATKEPLGEFAAAFEETDQFPAGLGRYTFKFVCDRGVSHELVRHRPASFAQTSTRYVNYGGKDMEFVEPWWYESAHRVDIFSFSSACEDAEINYNRMLSSGLAPQVARAVLPNALKTEIIVTADAAEWQHIFKLRCAKDAHPDIQRVMNMARELWEKKYGSEIDS